MTPSWKQYILGYLLGVITIPLLGAGLAVLYFVRKKQVSHVYKITDTQITSLGVEFRRNVDLVDIESVTVEQGWLQEKMGIGTLKLHTSAITTELVGLEGPFQLKDMIEKAVAVQKKAAEPDSYREREDPPYKPGAMEKIDYLTGLWQQGLLSDDDFENERKNYE